MGILDFLKPRARFFAILCVVQWPIGRLFADVWWVELSTHFLPQQISLFVACLAIWLLPATKRGAIAMALVISASVLGPMVIARVEGALRYSVQTDVHVVAFNVLTSNSRKNEVLDYLRRALERPGPTILVLLEVDEKWAEAMKPLEERFKSTSLHPRSDNFGIAVYSDIPLENVDVVSLEAACEAPQFIASAKLPRGPLKIIGVHTLPPSVANFDVRNECLEKIEEEALGEMPTVVIGDLNTSPWSPWFPKRLHDAFSYLARVHTWSALGGIVSTSLDHILVNDKLQAYHPSVGPDLGSDHRPVTAKLRFK